MTLHLKYLVIWFVNLFLYLVTTRNTPSDRLLPVFGVRSRRKTAIDLFFLLSYFVPIRIEFNKTLQKTGLMSV